MTTIVSTLGTAFLSRQIYIPLLDSTPINILGNPAPNGRHMLVFIDGNTNSYISSVELLSVRTINPQRGFMSRAFYMSTTDDTEWRFTYQDKVFILAFSSDAFYISCQDTSFNNLVIRELLMAHDYTGIDNIYGVDKITTQNPSSSSVISFLKPFTQTSTLANAVNLGQGVVTQTGSVTNSVNVNTASGVITTVSLSIAAGNTQSFLVNNTTVTSTSSIHLTLCNYTGSSLPPYLWASNVSNGSFQINISNTNTLISVIGVAKISFLVC